MEFQTVLSELVKCFGTTLAIFLLTLIGSLPLGLLVCFGRRSKNCVLRNVTKAYISIMRGTPLMLQLWVVFFGLPMLLNWFFGLFGLRYIADSQWRFTAAIIAFIIKYAAYFAEIYRSGIECIPKGQYEAANVLGYGRAQAFVKIILPQMVKNVMPSVTNEVITLVKDTSLCYSIGLVEMFTRATQIANSSSDTFFVAFMTAGVMYYIFNFVVAWLMERCEKAMAYYS